MNLMSRIEMIGRLERGEDPLELSIEKWLRIEEVYLKEHIYTGVSAATCALCYEFHDLAFGGCGTCPFLLTHGHQCDKRGPNENCYYQDAVRDIQDKADRGNVRLMIEALEKCKEKREPMGKEEMRRRVEEGEDPLELSIEKWKRIKEIYLDRNVLDFVFRSTCPLCYVSGSRYRCNACLLVSVTGHGCHRNEAWAKARSDVEERVDRGGVDRMIRMLEECKEERDKKERMKREAVPAKNHVYVAVERFASEGARTIIIESQSFWGTGFTSKDEAKEYFLAHANGDARCGEVVSICDVRDITPWLLKKGWKPPSDCS